MTQPHYYLNNAYGIKSSATEAWEMFAQEEGIAGTLTISLSASGRLHSGEIKMGWRVNLATNGPQYRDYTVEGAELDECVQEILQRVLRDQKKTVLTLPHEAVRKMPAKAVQEEPPLNISETFC